MSDNSPSDSDRRQRTDAQDTPEPLSAYEHQHLEPPDIPDIHRAVLREQFEPTEGQQRVPVLLFLLFLGLAMWAGWYLSEHDGNFQADVYDGPAAFRQMDLAQASQAESVQVDPVLLGQRIYNSCVSCHQTDGAGVAGKYPPLNRSEWVLGDDRILARILLLGLEGPITVRGQTYNAQMPAWQQLSDRDIAGVLTYIRQAWDNQAEAVPPETIAATRKEIGRRSSPFTAEELLQLETQLPVRQEGDNADKSNERSESNGSEGSTGKDDTQLDGAAQADSNSQAGSNTQAGSDAK